MGELRSVAIKPVPVAVLFRFLPYHIVIGHYFLYLKGAGITAISLDEALSQNRAELLMSQMRVNRVEVGDSRAHALNAFALQFELAGGQVLFDGEGIDVEEDGAMVEQLVARIELVGGP